MQKPLGIIALIAPFALASAPFASAQSNDMFPTKIAAEKRGKELKCTGAFAMGSEWMPCANFEAYEKALKK
jgi:hypothetical protein